MLVRLERGADRRYGESGDSGGANDQEHSMMRVEEHLVLALGEGALALWGRFPHDVQRLLFEQVVMLQGESARPKLASLLHHYHPRTAPTSMRDIPEPDSLGG